jgi:hypothetical protein
MRLFDPQPVRREASNRTTGEGDLGMAPEEVASLTPAEENLSASTFAGPDGRRRDIAIRAGGPDSTI